MFDRLLDRAWRFGLPVLLVAIVASTVALRGLRVDEDDDALGADEPTAAEAVHDATARARDDYASALRRVPHVALLVRAREGATAIPERALVSIGDLLAGHRHVADGRFDVRMGDDKRAALVRTTLAFAPSESAKIALDRLLGDTRSRLARWPELRLHASGVPVVDAAAVRAIGVDQRTVVPLVVGVIALVLALGFRCVQGVVLPLALAGASVLLTMGLYAASGERLNVMTSLLTPVALVMALCVGIHLVHATVEASAGVANRRAAVLHALRRVWLPSLLTTATTAIGLLTLLTSTVPGVRSFGLFGAVAVVVSWALGFVFLPPALLRWAPRRQRSRIGHALGRRVSRMGALPAFAMTAVVVVVSVGAGRLTVDTDFIGTLRPSNPARVDHRAIETAFPGALSLDVVADVGGVDSATRDAIRAAIARVPDVASAEWLPAAAYAIAPPSSSRAGLRIGVGPLTSAEGAVVKRAVADRLARLPVDAHGTRWRFAGPFNKIITDSDALAQSQLRSIALAVLVIVATLAVVFRDWRLTVLAIIANAAPIGLLFGIMGWFGIPLSVATSMTACVALGIAVDDTVHVLCRYRDRRSAGREAPAAMHDVVATTGGALTLTTAALAIGFAACGFGSFVPTTAFSLLLALTLVLAWLCDIVLLPACAIALESRRRARRVVVGSVASR